MANEKDPKDQKLVPVEGGNVGFELSNRGAQPGQAVVRPRNVDELLSNARMIAFSNLVPDSFRGKPEDVAVAIQMGMEIGLHPIQALQSIAVIKGRPCLWGDAVKALVFSSGLCEYWIDSPPDQIRATGVAVCRTKRRGTPEEQQYSFSIEDAQTAGLWGKVGPWTTNPGRMLLSRARGFLARDVYPDVLCGMAVREEVEDFEDYQAGEEAIAPIAPPRRKSDVTTSATAPPEQAEVTITIPAVQTAAATSLEPLVKATTELKRKVAAAKKSEPQTERVPEEPPFEKPPSKHPQKVQADLTEQLSLMNVATQKQAPKAQEPEPEEEEDLDMGAAETPAKPAAAQGPSKWQLNTLVQYAGKQIRTGGASAITLVKVQRQAERFDQVHYENASKEALETLFSDDPPPAFEYLTEQAARDFLLYMKENER